MQDALLVKYEVTPGTSGEAALQWAHQIWHSEGIQLSMASGLARGSDGAIYVVGHTRYDGYVVRVDEVDGQSELVWELDTSPENDAGRAFVIHLSVDILPDQDPNLDTLFVSGSFAGTANFEPPMASRGDRDVFLVQLDVSLAGSTDVAIWQVGGTERDNGPNLFSRNPDPVVVNCHHLEVSASGSVYELIQSSSPLVQTPAGTLVSSGEQDGVLIHIDPDAPQLRIEPGELLIEQQYTDEFSAFDSNVPRNVDWWLDQNDEIEDPIETGVNSISVSALALGRHTVTIRDSSSVTFRHIFDVSPNAPFGLTGDVAKAGKNSEVTLGWNYQGDLPNGFYVEYNNPQLTSGWELLADYTDVQLPGPFEHTHTVKKNIGVILYRVRSYVDVGNGILVSPVTEVLEVDPAVIGTFNVLTDGLLSSDVAAAVDMVLAEDESLIGIKTIADG